MYITDQRKAPYASMRLGAVSVAYGGCGAVAVYNALVSLQKPAAFPEILQYFSARSFRTLLHGRFGMLPGQVAAYFKKHGYRVKITASKRAMDSLARTAAACILFYMFPVKKTFLGLQFPIPEAHFVEFSRISDGYLARNTNNREGTACFSSPSAYGRRKSRFLPMGIFIFPNQQKTPVW